MSVDRIHYLVVPRVVASVVMFPMLTMPANIVGVAGAYVISVGVYDLEGATYLSQMFRNLRPNDVISGLIKAAVMGAIVSTN